MCVRTILVESLVREVDIDIDYASYKTDHKRFVLNKRPAEIERPVA
jgi:hypothetical protein